MLQVERRCTLAHELAHVDLRHTMRPTEREEEQAARLAAVKLIDWDNLIDAYRWASCMAEWADELWVTVEVLEDRLRFLSPVELGLLDLIRRSKHG